LPHLCCGGLATLLETAHSLDTSRDKLNYFKEITRPRRARRARAPDRASDPALGGCKEGGLNGARPAYGVVQNACEARSISHSAQARDLPNVDPRRGADEAITRNTDLRALVQSEAGDHAGELDDRPSTGKSLGSPIKSIATTAGANGSPLGAHTRL